ncbi:hypothetical protein [Cohnella herbarum]|uniref:Uncharacterized protein n=1 Tax=Cohnella herbarum TaxID=2728023 RepID=A0A7Z2VJS1_9BACL|nr:hypothetical protein [Cohnella herbarum]QJD84250.1 hypothetical protein HH215_14330 [Cohnella herbarum]
MTLLIAYKLDDSIVFSADTKESFIGEDGTVHLASVNKRKIFQIYSNVFMAVSGLASNHSIDLIRSVLLHKRRSSISEIINCCREVLYNHRQIFQRYNNDDTRGATKAIICGKDPESNELFIYSINEQFQTTSGIQAVIGHQEDRAREIYRTKFVQDEIPYLEQAVDAATSTIEEMSNQSEFIGTQSITYIIKAESITQSYYNGTRTPHCDRFLDKNIIGQCNTRQ